MYTFYWACQKICCHLYAGISIKLDFVECGCYLSSPVTRQHQGMTEPHAGASGGEVQNLPWRPKKMRTKLSRYILENPEFLSWAVLTKRLKARKNVRSRES